MITIISNGSKWAGDQPDTIPQLLAVLKESALDRTFERFGNFITISRKTGEVSLFGNFFEVSHVFNIKADKREEVADVIKAIRANKRRPDYLAQPVPPPLPKGRLSAVTL